MYIITDKETNVILGIGSKLDYMENGYPRLIEEDVAFVTELVNVYEVDSVPEGIEEYKYCYDGKEYTENPDYVDIDEEPIPEEEQEILNEE